MNQIELGNRPTVVPQNVSILDFEAGGKYLRVSLKLLGTINGMLQIDAQAFEVDAMGQYITGPDGRPSRIASSVKTVMASGLNDTRVLNPGWVRIVGTYSESDFENLAPPIDPVIGDKWFDLAEQKGYEYVEGEKLRIAKGAVNEMLAVVANSHAIAGIGF